MFLGFCVTATLERDNYARSLATLGTLMIVKAKLVGQKHQRCPKSRNTCRAQTALPDLRDCNLGEKAQSNSVDICCVLSVLMRF